MEHDTPEACAFPRPITASEPPARTTLDRLKQIPGLVREILDTIGAPNPGEEVARRPHVPGSKPPIDLHIVDLLRTTDHRDEDQSHVPILRLAQCSRIVWEALDDDLRAEHPQPEGLAWETECAWLVGAWPTAQAFLDLADIEWIETDVADIHAALCQAARLRPEKRYICPTCQDVMRLQPGGGYFVCDSGVHQHPGPVALMQQWRRKPPASAREIVAMFTEANMAVTEDLLRQWRKRGKIPPAGTVGRIVLMLPWDVLRVMLPDVVEAFDREDVA